MNKVRWGILGTGGICRRFAKFLEPVRHAELIAVGSRSADAANKFGEEFGIPNRHSSYEKLAGDASVDVIYVGTPHTFHKENTILCLNNGKGVLCEKPFAINTGEAQEMVDCARKNKRFLMEAMWTHFFPAAIEVQKLITSGQIGDVRLLNANFCFRAGWNPEGRLLNPELGGGALLDVGVYVVAFAHLVYGKEPTKIAAIADIGETGIDELTGMILGYENGAQAVMTSAIRVHTPDEAAIYGTEGYIKIQAPFWQPTRISICTGDKEKKRSIRTPGDGFSIEARAVTQCMSKGLLECDVMPLEKSLAIMRTLDRIRKEIGLKYPME